MLAVDTGTILNFLQSIPTRPDRLTTGEQALVKTAGIIIGLIGGELTLAEASEQFTQVVAPLDVPFVELETPEPFFMDDDPEPEFLKNLPVLLYTPELGANGGMYLPDVDPFKVYGKDVSRDQQ